MDVMYELEGLLFIWNNLKAKNNVRKHGISFEEAATVFIVDGAEELNDVKHSNDEDRIIIIGLSRNHRILAVVHCWRENDTVIRIISARKATQSEKNLWKW